MIARMTWNSKKPVRRDCWLTKKEKMKGFCSLVISIATFTFDESGDENHT